MTQLTDKVTAMPIPDGAEGVYFDGRASIGFYLNGELRFIHFPPGTYRFLFTTKTATEEDARKVVERTHAGGFGRSGEEFKNYLNNGAVCYTAIDSLNTLKRQMELDPKNNYAIIEKLK